ncbi:formate dehydrogenase accessory protein FdhE [Maridesulfovibrio frigidus]|uniref:formate dehydrogenase accessory protein FdhE n=1 Tax=Maridesulfovibrio frigidus TaxID=340956 RepID=UPI0004E1E7B4|nr:formate dehydrogenase accessory protein FdhE [Maridesulfovibrio frigidus]
MENIQSPSTSKHDVLTGLLALREQTPALENIFDAFGPILKAQEDGRILLEKWNDFKTPEADALRFEQGVPILAGMDMPSLDNYFSKIFWNMASALAEGMPAIADKVTDIIDALKDSDSLNDLARCVWEEDNNAIEVFAKEASVDITILTILGSLSLKPFMNRMKDEAAVKIENMVWNKGYCPICGCFPDMSLLKKKITENAEYMAGHGGQRWMHCSCCDHQWRIKRNICPWCDSEDYKKLSYLQSEETKTERADICDTCKRYYVTIDTRDLTEMPDPRIAPLSLVHLDVKAQEEGYEPMAETLWNSL